MMADPPGDSGTVKLTVANFGQWKRQCINKALSLEEYEIMVGLETAPAATEPLKERQNFRSRQSRMAGYLRKTLDHAQTESILANIGITDIHSIWNALLGVYEPKTAGSRTTAMQELIQLCKKEDESYMDYGSRCITIATKLCDLLPSAPTLVPASTDSTGNTIPAHLSAGYTALD